MHVCVYVFVFVSCWRGSQLTAWFDLVCAYVRACACGGVAENRADYCGCCWPHQLLLVSKLFPLCLQ